MMKILVDILAAGGVLSVAVSMFYTLHWIFAERDDQ